MFKPSRAMRRLHRNEEGITGLETAIILIAFVIVASVFAFVVLSTGLFSADRGKQTVLAGLEKASGNVEVRGSVSLQDVGTVAAPTMSRIVLRSLKQLGVPEDAPEETVSKD